MAAVPPPAGAMPPPVAVTLPGGNATPDHAIHLDPTDLFVVACPCLGWDFHAPAGGAIGAGTASIPHYKAVRSFAARCTIGDNPANKAAAAQCSPVVFALDAAAWSLILTELRDSDLFEHGPFTRLRDLDDAIDGLMIHGGFTIGEAPLYMSVEHATSRPRCEAHVPGRKGEKKKNEEQPLAKSRALTS